MSSNKVLQEKLTLKKVDDKDLTILQKSKLLAVYSRILYSMSLTEKKDEDNSFFDFCKKALQHKNKNMLQTYIYIMLFGGETAEVEDILCYFKKSDNFTIQIQDIEEFDNVIICNILADDMLKKYEQKKFLFQIDLE